MLKTVKTLFDGEKTIREINRKCDETIIDQLIREDLELDEKKKIANLLKRMIVNNDKWDEDNSDFWYKYGLEEGKVIGFWIGGAAMFAGFLIGAAISIRNR